MIGSDKFQPLIQQQFPRDGGFQKCRHQDVGVYNKAHKSGPGTFRGALFDFPSKINRLIFRQVAF